MQEHSEQICELLEDQMMPFYVRGSAIMTCEARNSFEAGLRRVKQRRDEASTRQTTQRISTRRLAL